MGYTKEQLQEALDDMKHFINMLKDNPTGVPVRLLISRDLIIKELQNYEKEKKI